MLQLHLRSKLFVLLSTVAIALAVLHAHDELTQNFTSCSVSSAISCGAVFASGYDSVFGIPFYMLGLLWFPLCVAVALVMVWKNGDLNRSILAPLLMVGNVFTLYLWYLQVFLIKAYCLVCISMYFINYGLTIISVLTPSNASISDEAL